jgi:short-subunit dehydrogenase involved in D-alanine esterification of teichoic acids
MKVFMEQPSAEILVSEQDDCRQVGTENGLGFIGMETKAVYCACTVAISTF